MLISPDETIELLSIQADEDFNAQCQKCLTNLKRCVQMAERAAQVDVTLVRAIIQPLQNIVRDRHLRLAIWMSDCGITDGSLSRLAPKSISPLSDTLASLFERVHADVEGIFRGFCDLETVANQVAEADRYISKPQNCFGCYLLTAWPVVPIYRCIRLR